MTTEIKPGLDQPILSSRELVGFLSRGARPAERWAIGTEVEKLVIDGKTGEAASFEIIETLLSRIEEVGNWRGIREEGRLLALAGPHSSITLEPGGQLELSGQLCDDLHCACGDFNRHISQIVDRAADLGLRFLGLGVQPLTPLNEISWLPKSRYRVMGPYMLKTGDMGQRMMKQTAGLQVNLDFADEADCIDKMRLCLSMVPVLYALFANSPLMDGRPSGFLSTRGEIWSRTDPDRTGLLDSLFEPEAGFHSYVDYALDVPMYFISRQGRYLDFTGERITFRRYLADGHLGHRATLSDWDLHLSTLFPEVRLRPQIELRSADSLPPHLTLAVAALAKGVLYDSQARDEARQLYRHQCLAERHRQWRDSWRLGLRAPAETRTLREVALDLLDIARRGLARQARRNIRGLDETIFLEGIQEVAESGVTLAERLLARWHGSREERVQALLDHCGFARGTAC